MSIYLDMKYLRLSSTKLERFSQKKQFLWNFRCPFCGDSKKNKLKARGYFYRKKDKLYYVCHNCHASASLPFFLKQMDPILYQEYQMENFKEESCEKPRENTADLEIFKSQPVISKKYEFTLPSIASLGDEHPAKMYINNRLIPKERHEDLYYAENFLDWAKDVFPIEKSVPNDPRIVIPFFDQENNLMGAQGRAITDTKIRYITMKMGEGYRKVYGLDRIDLSKTIYVFEGPFDSMFIPNSLATMDSSLQSIKTIVGDYDYVLVFDNQPRNKDVCREINRSIVNNMKVVIWPNNFGEKDINDMVLSGISKEDIFNTIKENTFESLKAQLEFNVWKKV